MMGNGIDIGYWILPVLVFEEIFHLERFTEIIFSSFLNASNEYLRTVINNYIQK